VPLRDGFHISCLAFAPEIAVTPIKTIHDLQGVTQVKEKRAAVISNQAPANVTKPITDMQEQIRRRAYELYERRGTPGYELEDWLQAESEVAEQMKPEGAG
jgi:hypothetical protein